MKGLRCRLFLLMLLLLSTWTATAQIVPDTLRREAPEAVPDSVMVPEKTPSDSTGTVFEPDHLSLSARFLDFLRPQGRVYPLRLAGRPNFVQVESDSTLRWQQWNEYSDRLSRQPGVISNRLGGFNRNDLHLDNGFSGTSQRLYLDGMSLNNPVTGFPLYAHLPLERTAGISRFEGGGTLRTDVETQRYYVSKPLTRVTYDQTSFEQRFTDGHVTQMITPHLGLDMAYLGKNTAGEYPMSRTESRQAMVRLFYHIRQDWLLQSSLNYSGVQLQESDGYILGDLFLFNFNRFFATPVRNGARSSVRNSHVQLSLMRRAGTGSTSGIDTDSLRSNPGASVSQDADTRFSLHHSRYRRFYYANSDSTYYRVMGYHASMFRKWSYGEVLDLSAELRSGWYYLDPEKNRSVDFDSWLDLEAEVHANLHLNRWVLTPFFGRLSQRSDGFRDWETGGGVLFQLPVGLEVGLTHVLSQKSPTIQQLYWQGSYRGNADLSPVEEARINIHVGYTLDRLPLSIHTGGYLVEQRNGIYITPDSTFSQFGTTGQWGALVSMAWDSENWELTASGTLQQFTNVDNSVPAQFLGGSGLRIWNRGSIHWKGYLFDRATYAKIGFYGMFSPNIYRPARYVPVIDNWDFSLEELEIPAFARLDFDVSARVRYMMFLLRWENITQGLGQFGYYEAAPYPMPSRRLRFGIRVIFRN